MARNPMNRVAIVGDGPAGTTLAALLAREGRSVVLYARGRPRGPVVGESLVPAVVPLLRQLGIEDEVRSFGELKPGATFLASAEDAVHLRFDDFAGRRAPGYAYNVPRDRFDATLLEVCRRSGVRLVEATAGVERESGSQRVRLTQASLAAAGLDAQPDLLVDASGRARLLARLLDLPTRPGTRRDTALFAHCEGVPIDRAGHVHTDRLERGWCWRIPLPGRVSFGLVVDPEVLRPLGSTPEQQYHALLDTDPYLKRISENCRRLTPVVRYNNYQLTTLQGVGDGWALVGDAFGFIDPVFSSGLFLAMDGAARLARAIQAGTPAALRAYERFQRRHIEAWRKVVGYYYDGRFFSLFRMSQQKHESWVGRLVAPHLGKHLPKVFTGESTMRRYDPWLLDFMIRHGLTDPEEGYPVVS